MEEQADWHWGRNNKCRTNLREYYKSEVGRRELEVNRLKEYNLRPRTCRKVDIDTLPVRKMKVPSPKDDYLRSRKVPDPIQAYKEYSDMLSNLGDLKQNEKFATIAIRLLNNTSKKYKWPSVPKENYGLVEFGPIASAPFSDGLLLFHFNFKAKASNDVHDSIVHSFFIQLIIIPNTNHVIHLPIFHLGPTSKLPDKAETFGCLYCSFHNVHHPEEDGRVHILHNGREDHLNTFAFQILKLNRRIQKSKREGFVPKVSHPGVLCFSTSYLGPSTQVATVALNLFKSENKGGNFELVRLGSFGKDRLVRSLLFHINFEAKNKDDPDAPIQTFFAEFYHCSMYIFVLFCKCLGPSDLILPEEPQKYGCTMCVRARVHHPPGPGYVNGREYYKT